jgi:hypothetical protein
MFNDLYGLQKCQFKPKVYFSLKTLLGITSHLLFSWTPLKILCIEEDYLFCAMHHFCPRALNASTSAQISSQNAFSSPLSMPSAADTSDNENSRKLTHSVFGVLIMAGCHKL